MTTDYRVDPHQIKPLTPTGTTVPDGAYGVTVVGGVVTGYEPVSVPADTPLVTVVDGIPGLVFDDDGSIVYTEVPA